MSKYRREPLWSVALKNQLKTAPETLQIVIGEDGSVTMIDSPAARVIAESLGSSEVARASHVEPDNVWLRAIFYHIRSRVSDDSWLAAWTRRWRCWWRVTIVCTNEDITLPGLWRNREDAIAAEVAWLNEYFVTH